MIYLCPYRIYSNSNRSTEHLLHFTLTYRRSAWDFAFVFEKIRDIQDRDWRSSMGMNRILRIEQWWTMIQTMIPRIQYDEFFDEASQQDQHPLNEQLKNLIQWGWFQSMLCHRLKDKKKTQVWQGLSSCLREKKKKKRGSDDRFDGILYNKSEKRKSIIICWRRGGGGSIFYSSLSLQLTLR